MVCDKLLESSQFEQDFILIIRAIVKQLILNGITTGMTPNSALFDLEAEEMGVIVGVMVLEARLISLKLEAKGLCAMETKVIGGNAGMEVALVG